LRKYFLPSKKRAHEGCPQLKGAHLILNEIRSRTVEKRSSWGAGLRRPAYRLRSRPRGHTLGHQSDDGAFFGPKTLSRKIISLDSDILDLVKKAVLWLAAADAARMAGITWNQNMASPSEG
jgi:hypothetical protein